MLESLGVDTWIAAGAVGLALAVLGFIVGRRTGSGAAVVRGLEEELDTVRVTAAQRQEELEQYRGRVAEHFSETSEKLHELTLHYRGVYDHLAQGASDLCPQGFEQLGAGLGLGSLPDQAGSAADEALADQDSLEFDGPSEAGELGAGDAGGEGDPDAADPLAEQGDPDAAGPRAEDRDLSGERDLAGEPADATDSALRAE